MRSAFMVNSSDKQLKDIMKKCRSIGNPHCGACRENMALQNKPLDMGQLWGLLRKRLTEKKNRKFADIIAADPWDFWSAGEPREETCAVCHTETGTLTTLHHNGDDNGPVRVCALCKMTWAMSYQGQNI